MAHFAKIFNNKVTQVVTIEEDKVNILPDSASWVQCSYNTHGGIHHDPITKEITSGSKALRYNFPQPGWNYDSTADAFYKNSPFPSWVLNTGSYTWEPPSPPGWPTDDWQEVGSDHTQSYEWNEVSQSWTAVN